MFNKHKSRVFNFRQGSRTSTVMKTTLSANLFIPDTAIAGVIPLGFLNVCAQWVFLLMVQNFSWSGFPESKFGRVLKRAGTSTLAFHSSAKARFAGNGGKLEIAEQASEGHFWAWPKCYVGPDHSASNCALHCNYQLSHCSHPHKGTLWSCPSHKASLSIPSSSVPRWNVRQIERSLLKEVM